MFLGAPRAKKSVFSVFSLWNPSCIGIYNVFEILQNFCKKMGIYNVIWRLVRKKGSIWQISRVQTLNPCHPCNAWVPRNEQQRIWKLRHSTWGLKKIWSKNIFSSWFFFTLKISKFYFCGFSGFCLIFLYKLINL